MSKVPHMLPAVCKVVHSGECRVKQASYQRVPKNSKSRCVDN